MKNTTLDILNKRYDEPLEAVQKAHGSGGRHMVVGGGGPKQSQSAFKIFKMELDVRLLVGH